MEAARGETSADASKCCSNMLVRRLQFNDYIVTFLWCPVSPEGVKCRLRDIRCHVCMEPNFLLLDASEYNGNDAAVREGSPVVAIISRFK